MTLLAASQLIRDQRGWSRGRDLSNYVEWQNDMTLGYDIGLSAIRAQQVRIATHGNNIANAATPGYARQVVDLAERPQHEYRNLLLGTGVDATAVRSLRDAAAEAGLARNSTLSGSVEAQLDAARSLDSLLIPTETSIHATISDVFNNLERVANTPEDVTARSEFVRSAETLVEQAAFISESLSSVEADVARNHANGVEVVNALVDQIATLNARLNYSKVSGETPHALLTQRDDAVAKLSEWIDVKVSPSAEGPDIVLLGGGSVLFTVNPITLSSEVSKDGVLSIQVDPGREVIPGGGKLEGLEVVHNSTSEEARGNLDTLVSEIVRQLDQLHATGLSSPDGFQALTATRGPKHTGLALTDANLAFPVTAGEIFVTVTDQSTGTRSTQSISVDPDSESLEDIAAKLSAIDNINVLISDGSNQLVIRASEGFSFDFAGRPDNVPDTTLFTGTSQVTFSGAYTPQPAAERAFDPRAIDPAAPPVNQQFSVTLPATGQIGVTEGLIAEVRDSAGILVQTIPVGPEYSVGSPVSLNNGLYVAFSDGDVVANDQVSIDAIQQPDTSGLLSALGVNSLFTGSTINSYHVRTDIQDDPFLFSASLTGEFGDAGAAALMADIRDHRFANLSDQTFVESIADLTALAGLDVQELEKELSQLEDYRSQLQASRDSLAGVDTNEELLQLLAAERAFQAAAKFVSTYDDTVVELLGLVG